MPPRPTARAALRTASAADHDTVDGIFSAADLTTTAGYRQFLSAQAAAHLPAEAALERDGVAAIMPDWPARRRAALLVADLAGIAGTAPAPAGPIAFAGPSELLGGLYVLEGSRLGGSVLKRSVAPHLPASFLGAADSAAWRRLLQMIDERLVSPEDMSAAIAAARRVFALFAASGRQWLKAD